MSLEPPLRVRKLQMTLQEKAKASPTYRFYSLYDKLYREDVLAYAWLLCRKNGGVAGVDGQTFERIEEEGVEKWLDRLAEELRHKTYRPQAVRRVWIPKPDGKRRPLGIPTIRDRVAQMAAVLVLSPIFEVDLAEEQYAYREGRSALDAVKKVHALLNMGYTEVIDADLSGYFDSIPHHALMKSLARRISDGVMLALLKAWLEMPVEEEEERGRKRRTTQAKDRGRGTPQGAPISPLLANLYMRRFILGWKRQGWAAKWAAHIVSYADDYVILCRHHAQEAREQMERIMERIGLTVNQEKTRICRVPEQSFDFLGYTFGLCHKPITGHSYLGTQPSKKRVNRLLQSVSEQLRRDTQGSTGEELVSILNRRLRGWANYFCLGSVSRAYRTVDRHVRYRLRRWLCRKHKVLGQGKTQFPHWFLQDKLGLLSLGSLTRSLPWA
ncbi:group II intron reverse transcriptase/maturase [Methylacidimicrobium tartarophylax]|uniref:Group II intron-encoded protein LtrA n=1 Tax=Methylacidimicrobium tartarophylax TaxID=1041768 RepID=A0A5E6MDJ7_9BACT|nr:group II intron reverse transcriptase/maturase [Methylacidimicrobium tartarophylax]VVM07628.1 Group II intron-encoded protein LtrA [Methylacidimicrobium tartarophylax]